MASRRFVSADPSGRGRVFPRETPTAGPIALTYRLDEKMRQI